MKKSYYSPFPRQKSNNEVLRNSYASLTKKHQGFIEIPSTLTVSYMEKNPYYFDLKKAMKAKAKPTQSQSNTQRYTVFNNKRLDNILNSNRDQYVYSRPKLNSGCEMISPKQKKRAMTAKQIRELTPAEALKIINKIEFPDPKQFTKIPK